jgi:uncharacterized protein (TIGR02117 family)
MPLLRSILQFFLLLLDLLVLYFVFAVIGLFLVRNANERLNNSGIPLIIHGDGFHTELYLPLEDSVLHHNWLQFLNDSIIIQKHRQNKLINFGWAEEDWSVAGAKNKTGVLMAFETLLWPWNKSIMHVQLMDTVHTLKKPFTVKRFLTATQYQQLIAFIINGFMMSNNKPLIRSYEGYYGHDYFFSSNRYYNAFNTCNQWVADALNSCSVRNPAFAPFGWSIAYQIKK